MIPIKDNERTLVLFLRLNLQKEMDGNRRGVITKVPTCSFKVSEFDLQPFIFGLLHLRKVLTLSLPQLWVK